MKNNNTAIFEKSARRTLHFAVTSRWPGTSDSRAHEFMTPSCAGYTDTVSILMGDAVQKDRSPPSTRTIIETTFRTRTSHFVFHSK